MGQLRDGYAGDMDRSGAEIAMMTEVAETMTEVIIKQIIQDTIPLQCDIC